MFDTVAWHLRAPRTVALPATATIRNVDLTGATFLLEIRDRRDGGALRASLGTASSAAEEGVRVASVDTSGALPVTALSILINETTMEAMPASPDPGTDYDIWWGMHITPAGGIKFLAFDAKFTLVASTPA